jgi:hypothetical protein
MLSRSRSEISSRCPILAHRHLDAALVADDAAMLHALVFAAQALPVGDRSKDAGAEKPIPLRFEGAVVDGLRLGYFAMRPTADLLRRCQHDADGVEVGDGTRKLKRVRTEQGDPPWQAFFAPTAVTPGILFEDPSFPGSGDCRSQEGP